MSQSLSNRAARRAMRRTTGMVGLTMLATTGLLGAYLGNPRLPRAYAAGVQCGATVTDLPTWGAALTAFSSQSTPCDTITVGADVEWPNIGTITGSVPLTIDGQGHTLTPYAASPVKGALSVDLPMLTVKDVTFTTFAGAPVISAVNGTDVTLDGVTFTQNPGGAMAASGGDIAITGSVFDANVQVGGSGSTITLTTADSVAITRSTFTGNTAGGTGAVYISRSTGTLAVPSTITNSLFARNTGGSHAGAVFSSNGDLNVTGTTFDRNSGTTGGGIRFQDGNLSLLNSTLSGNTASATAGGIHAVSGSASVVFSTLSGNTSASGNVMYGFYGHFSITNSIITNPGATTGQDIVALFGTAGASYSSLRQGTYSDGSVTTFATDGVAGNQVGRDPRLGALGDNGGILVAGSTTKHIPTMSPLPGSPLVNAGVAGGSDPTTDQRGPGYPRAYGTAPDMGAVEVGACSPASSTVVVGGITYQVRTFTGGGSCVWAPPAGATDLSALLVGSGGAGSGGGYGGGGGEVKVVALGATGDVTVSVGSSGADGDAAQSQVAQGAISEAAQAGTDGGPFDRGGSSGNGNLGAFDFTTGGGGGGGAGSAAANLDGGAGTTAADAAAATGPFGSDTTCYGGGGAGGIVSGTTPTWQLTAGAVTCGGGTVDPPTAASGTGPWSWTGSADDVTTNAPRANSGGGGVGVYGVTTGFTPGANGVVEIRYREAPSGVTVTVTPYPAAKTIKYGYATPSFRFKATVGEPPVAFTGTWTTPPTCSVQLPVRVRGGSRAYDPEVPGTILPVGTYPVVCTGGVGSAGETVTYVDGTLTVAPAYAVKVYPRSGTWTTGQTPPALGYTASGFKNAETFASPGMTAPTCGVFTGQGGTGSPVTIDSATPAGTYYNHCSGAVTTANYISPVQYASDGVVKVLPVVTTTITRIRPSYGYARGGTKVYVYGTGFAPGTTVSIGGVTCTRVSVNRYGTQITCYTGAHAPGLVDVVVTAPGGTATLTNGYRYK